MTTIEKIRAEIQKVLDAEGDSESAKAQALALFWVLELFDKYAEQEPTEERQNRDFNIECQNHNAMLHKARENVIEKFKSCADMFSDEELNGAETVMNWIQEETQKPQEPCDDAEQIDYHDDFETALRKIYDYEERQKENDKRCGNCKLIGTDSCYMMCGGSKSLYKPKQKIEPCDDVVSREAVIKVIDEHTFETDEGLCLDDDITCILEEIPSVRPQEQTGHWILKRTFPTKLYDEYLNEYKCSECYRKIRCTESQLVNYPYCHCGAKMVEPQESEDKE